MKHLWENAQKEFEGFWIGKTQWVYAMEDTRAILHKSNERMKLHNKARPSDYIVVDNGKMFFAEVKSSQSSSSFNLNNIEEGQWFAAIRSTAAGGLYFFFVKSEIHKEWFKIPASVFIEQRSTKKSIKWEELSPYLFESKK